MMGPMVGDGSMVGDLSGGDATSGASGGMFGGRTFVTGGSSKAGGMDQTTLLVIGAIVLIGFVLTKRR